MEVYRVRPTRSGRQPKPKKLRARNINTLDNGVENESLVNNDTTTSLQETPSLQEITKDLSTRSKNSEDETTSCSENIATVISDINQMKPGSLVILTQESVEEPGETILQVYMVSSNVDKKNTNDETVKTNVTPAVLSPESLSTVTNKIEDAKPINAVDDCE